MQNDVTDDSARKFDATAETVGGTAGIASDRPKAMSLAHSRRINRRELFKTRLSVEV